MRHTAEHLIRHCRAVRTPTNHEIDPACGRGIPDRRTFLSERHTTAPRAAKLIAHGVIGPCSAVTPTVVGRLRAEPRGSAPAYRRISGAGERLARAPIHRRGRATAPSATVRELEWKRMSVRSEGVEREVLIARL
jgi:hypothetical protein